MRGRRFYTVLRGNVLFRVLVEWAIVNWTIINWAGTCKRLCVIAVKARGYCREWNLKYKYYI